MSRPWRDILLIAAAGALAFFPYLNDGVHVASREMRHAEISRELAESGDLLVPKLLGEPYYDKPPVMHAAIALLYQAAGEPALWLARTPSALAGIAGAVLLYLIARMHGGERLGLYSALGLLSVPGYALNARIARPDMVYAAAILAACLAFALAARRERVRRSGWLVFAGAGAAVATLCKGPLGLAFPLLFALLWPVGRAELTRPSVRGWFVFAAGLFLTAGSWIVPVYLRDGGEYLGRVLNQPDLELEPAGGYASALLAYVLPQLTKFLPLTLFLPLVALDVKRRGWSGPLLIALAGFALLSLIPKKRDHYLLPLHPFLALATVEALLALPGRAWLLRSARILMALGILYAPLRSSPWLAGSEGVDIRKRHFCERVLAAVPEGAPILCYGELGEKLAFWGRRGSISDAVDLDELWTRMRALGAGTRLVLPTDLHGDLQAMAGGSFAFALELSDPTVKDSGHSGWSLYRSDPPQR